MNNQYFDIPVALFIFRRTETVIRIIKVLEEVKPLRLYLIADGPRNEEEKKEILETRKRIEESINWNCEIIKNYAVKNRGVYENIAGGAKWVFEREQSAIFLEDDNLPEVTFFQFCREMLEKYKENDRILWICGTNYLEKFLTEEKESYVFTKHLMPCGWASWAEKFNRYYDGDLKILEDKNLVKQMKNIYTNHALYKQQLVSANSEIYRRNKNKKYASWDFQMAISIRANNLYGICPKYNQIKNIGVDLYSIHGGTSLSNEMTRRFCGINSYPLEFPLKHPKIIAENIEFEKKVDKIILFPLKMRIKEAIAVAIKTLFGISRYEKFTLDNIKKGKWSRKIWFYKNTNKI